MRNVCLLILSMLIAEVNADIISLFDWGLNINNQIINGSSSTIPGNVTLSQDFVDNGLGTVTVEFSNGSAGSYSIGGFFDYEIIGVDNTYFNEYAFVQGEVNDSRLSYEIDEPGYSLAPYTGDIYNNFLTFSESGFDNRIFYDGISGTWITDSGYPISDDVAMGIGWNFVLDANETANVSFIISRTLPTDGFYLAHLDRNSEDALYLQTRLNIIPNSVPEPGIFSLMITGFIVALLAVRRLKTNN